MNDFRLKVFIRAAQTLNFTRCAEELFISQPAVSKHISEIENRYQVQLFRRSGNSLELTSEGCEMLKYAEQIDELYRNMQYQMSLFTDSVKGILRVGASSTISQYYLSPALARFTTHYPDINLTLISANSYQIETALSDNKIDIALVENMSHRYGLSYTHLCDDELVAVARTSYAEKLGQSIKLDKLCSLPLVLREEGSGTLEVIRSKLLKLDFKMTMLNIVIQLGSTESIKSFIMNSDTVAILSRRAIERELRDGSISCLSIEKCRFERQFSLVQQEGASNHVVDIFLQELSTFVNKD